MSADLPPVRLREVTAASPEPSLLSRRVLMLGLGGAVAGVSLVRMGGTAQATESAGLIPSARLTVTRRGMVQRAGVNFRTGGVNAFQLITNDYPSPRLMSRSEIDSLLTSARTLDAGVVRAHTLGASVGNPFTLVRGVSGTGPSPTIRYDQDVWDTIDYAVWKAGQLGICLIAPMVDEWGYYHGGKRHWVDFRHPGSVSLDPGVTSANDPGQRAAESLFYTDQQVVWDFRQYIRDWLTHVNPLTGVAFKDEPALSIVQVGNELWTAAQDAPGWVDRTAALIKSIAPATLVMDSGADGLSVHDMAWDSPHVDILETHPYSTFGPGDVSAMARFAASKGKAFAVGEYPWSKADAPDIEKTVRATGNVFCSALWSLQNTSDRHAAGASYGSDDVSFYLPGTDTIQRAAVTRVTAHHRALIRGASSAVSPTEAPASGAEGPHGRHKRRHRKGHEQVHRHHNRWRRRRRKHRRHRHRRG